MQASVLPANATNNSVTWTVTNGTGSATINTTGLLIATGDGTVTVTATANDGSGISGNKAISISNQSVGISELAITDISIFPNPVTDYMFIQIPKEYKNVVVEIFNNTGQHIDVNNNFNNNVYSIDLSGQVPGLYFISVIYINNKKITKKFIVL